MRCVQNHSKVQLNTKQMRYGLSVQSWPSGHATDSEEAIAFTELKHVDCMVEKFPLAEANNAFSNFRYSSVFSWLMPELDAMLNGTVRFRAVITMD